MKAAVLLLLLLCPALVTPSTSNIFIDVYSHHGMSADGSAARPFQSVAAARAAFPSWQDRIIHFGRGVYDISSQHGVLLGPGDAGAQLQGVGRNETLLSGGVLIQGWKEQTFNGKRMFTATVADNMTYFRQLFVSSQPNGPFSRRQTSRSSVLKYDHVNPSDTQHSIVYYPGQVLGQYHNQEDVLATLYHCWTATTHQIRSITASNNTLTLLRSPHVDIPRCEHASGKRFFIQNAVEYLDQAGEFYFDRANRTVSYLAFDDEQVDTFYAYAPQIVTLLEIRNTSNITVQNMSFVHGAADMDGFFKGDCDAQAASNLMSASVAMNKANDVTFEDVAVAHTGSWGIWPNESCTNIRMNRMDIKDVGAGGMRVGHFSASPTADPTAGVVVSNSTIHDGGHIYIMGPGIFFTACQDCSIEHNEISDFFYTAVSTGQGFSEAAVDLRDSRIVFNHMHNVGKGALSDMGCVYTFGGSQSNLLFDNNLCHGVKRYAEGYGGWGLYTDQTSRNIIFRNNIVYDTSDASYHDHDGNNITLVNNIFYKQAVGSDGVIISARNSSQAYWYAKFNLTRNIVVAGQGVDVFTDAKDCKEYQLSFYDINTYWAINGSVVFPGNEDLSKWQSNGCGKHPRPEDVHSIVADPLFADIANHNFTLLPSSPALKLGFVPIDMSTVGPMN